MKKEKNYVCAWLAGFLVLMMIGIIPPALVQAKGQRSERADRGSSPPPARQSERQKEAPSAPRTERKAERTEPARQEVKQQQRAQRESNASQRVEQKQAAREAQRAQVRENAAVQRPAQQSQRETKPQIASPREPERTEVRVPEPVRRSEPVAAVRNSREDRVTREVPRPVVVEPVVAEPVQTARTFDKISKINDPGRPSYRPAGSIRIDPEVRKPGKRSPSANITIVKKNVHIMQPVVVVERYTQMVHVEQAPIPIYEINEPCYDYDDYYPEEDEYAVSDSENCLYEGGYSYYNGNGIYIHQAGIPPVAGCEVIRDDYPAGGNYVSVTGFGGGYDYDWYDGPYWSGRMIRTWINPYKYYQAQYYWSRFGEFWWTCCTPPYWLGWGYCFLPF